MVDLYIILLSIGTNSAREVLFFGLNLILQADSNLGRFGEKRAHDLCAMLSLRTEKLRRQCQGDL